VDELQLRAAASYPDEAAEQHTDSAIAVIRQLVALGATQGIPREMSHPGLDSLFSFVARAAQPAKLVLGSRIAGSVLYVDGQPQGVVQGLRGVRVPAGKTVQLSTQTGTCTAWASTG